MPVARPSTVVRVLVGAPLLGAALGIAGAFVQAARTAVAGVSIPWGVALAGATVIACIRAATVLSGRRAGGVLLLAGWLIPTIISALESTDGDLGLQADARASAYLFGTVVIGSAVMVLSPPRPATEAP